jgi:hypothetical protein
MHNLFDTLRIKDDLIKDRSDLVSLCKALRDLSDPVADMVADMLDGTDGDLSVRLTLKKATVVDDKAIRRAGIRQQIDRHMDAGHSKTKARELVAESEEVTIERIRRIDRDRGE